ncbi:uncharacterized protein LOC130499038 [Raphanus sativus]|uniref:Uncharacterized protein LOC130499038 n=1 Tax=Raphanus sativus TaxID=3726 RepID=A0A9W3CBK6_RAPSA|nr:uncharacterized protein LOC130499038 [Raphanus sativus]
MTNDDVPSKIAKLSFWVLWYIWKSWNEFLFAKTNVHPIEDIHRAIAANDEWNAVYISKRSVQCPPLKSSAWEPPPTDWLKCNFDCSFRNDTRSAGIGWMIRDTSGSFLVGGMARLDNVVSAVQGEALGLLFALQQVWIRGWRKVWFEGDCVELTAVINQMVPHHLHIGNVLYDIRHWMSLLPDCSLASINRERNQAADVLSRRAFLEDNVVSCFSVPPSWCQKPRLMEAKIEKLSLTLVNQPEFL